MIAIWADSTHTHLHQLLFVVEVRHQDVLSIRHSRQGDSQPAAGLVVAVGGKGAPQHVTHNLHQVEGGMHGSQEALPRLFGHIDDARAGLSCVHVCVNNDGGKVFGINNLLNLSF